VALKKKRFDGYVEADEGTNGFGKSDLVDYGTKSWREKFADLKQKTDMPIESGGKLLTEAK